MSITVGQLQTELNRSSADEWQAYGPHRARVTQLVVRAGEPRPRPRSVCVLGAGNVNDLDLTRVLTTFQEIHLVDIDGEAIAAGLVRQGCVRAAGVDVHGGLDLDAGWHPQCRFDVVASTAVLSPIIDHKRREVPMDDARHLPHVLGARDRHLELLVRLTESGGTAILVSDIVSSDSVPELLSKPSLAGVSLVDRLVGEGNFFTGCNPHVLAARLSRNDRVSSLSVIPPWIWHIGPNRAYLAIAIVAAIDTTTRPTRCEQFCR